MGEITSLMERLSSSSRYSRGKHWLLPLHSSISADQQRAAFKVPPAGVRKIVLSTNIAETSVTLEDVVVVIDSGRHKERRFEPHKRMSLLVEDWVSRAAALQRRGRAGRVRAGTCYCCYTRSRFEQTMRQYAVPEVARVPLEELVLQIHLLGLGPAASFLQQLIQPPPSKAVEAALIGLQEVGAITILPATANSNASSEVTAAAAAAAGGSGAAAGEEVLTPLGRLLAVLPLEPRLGKLLVMGAALGCLAPALTIAAAFSHRSPFSAPLEKQDQLEAVRKALAAPAAADTTSSSSSGQGGLLPAAAAAARLAAGQQSDHLLLVAAFEMWRVTGAAAGDRAAAQVARRHFLSLPALEAMLELRKQFAALLQEAHLLPQTTQQQQQQPSSKSSRKWVCWADDQTHPANRLCHRPEVLKAALVAALSPQVAAMTAAAADSRPAWLDARAQQVYVHPSSVLSELTAAQLQQQHVVYLDKTKTTRVFLRDVSVASPLSLILFSGSLQVQHEAATVVIDGWLQIRVPAVTAVLLKRLRAAIDSVLTAGVTASNSSSNSSKGAAAGRGGLLSVEAVRVMSVVQQLLTAEVAEAAR